MRKSFSDLMVQSYVVAIVSLCAVCSLGTRIEMRWLYVPYAFILMMMAQIFASRQQLAQLLVTFSALLLVINVFYSMYYDRYYCYFTTRMRSELYKRIEENITGDEYSLAIIGNRLGLNEESVKDCLMQLNEECEGINITIYDSIGSYDSGGNYDQVLMEDTDGRTYVDMTYMVSG